MMVLTIQNLELGYSVTSNPVSRNYICLWENAFFSDTINRIYLTLLPYMKLIITYFLSYFKLYKFKDISLLIYQNAEKR